MAEFERKDYPALYELSTLAGGFNDAVRSKFKREGKINKFVMAYTPQEIKQLERLERKSFLNLDWIFMSKEKKQLEAEKGILNSLTIRELFARAACRVEDEQKLAVYIPKEMRQPEGIALLEKYEFTTLAKLARS